MSGAITTNPRATADSNVRPDKESSSNMTSKQNQHQNTRDVENHKPKKVNTKRNKQILEQGEGRANLGTLKLGKARKNFCLSRLKPAAKMTIGSR